MYMQQNYSQKLISSPAAPPGPARCLCPCTMECAYVHDTVLQFAVDSALLLVHVGSMSFIKTMTKRIFTVANIWILSNTQYEILSNIRVPERIGTGKSCQNCKVHAGTCAWYNTIGLG